MIAGSTSSCVCSSIAAISHGASGCAGGASTIAVRAEASKSSGMSAYLTMSRSSSFHASIASHSRGV